MQLLETEIVIKRQSIHKDITSRDYIGYSLRFSGVSIVQWQGKKQFMKVFISSIHLRFLAVNCVRDELNTQDIEASNRFTSCPGLKAHLKWNKYI